MSLTRRRQKYKKNLTRKYKLQSNSGVGDDFYFAVNKSWLHKTKIPSTKVAYGVSEEIEKKIEIDSQKLLKHCIVEAKSPEKKSYKSSLERLLGQLAVSVQEANTTNTNLLLVKNVLESIQTASNKEEIAVISGEFCKYKIHGLFHFYAQYENMNATKYTYTIGTGSLGLPDPSYYFEASFNRRLYYKKYKEFVKHLGNLFQIPNLECVIQLEHILAGVLQASQEESLKIKQKGHELEQKYTHIPWDIFFQTMGLSHWKSRFFFLSSKRWLSTVNILFHELGLDQWKLLLSLEFLLYSVTWLPPRYSDISFRFYRKLLRGQKKKVSRDKQAIYVVQQYATPFFSRLYTEHFIDPSVKTNILHMIEEFLHVAKERLETIEWLEPKTRKRAQEKIEAMKFIVAYPDSFEHHSLPKLDSQNLVANLLELGAWQTNYEIGKLGQPISQRKEWDDALFVVNAYYYEQANEMVIPSGILHPPFYDVNKSFAWNYGGIGCIISHEMTHAFDKEGKEFNEKGFQERWWTSLDHRNYTKQTERLIDLYSKQRVFGLPVSGKKTLSENIADIGGMSIALDALKKKLSTLQLTEKERKEYYQEFFISYAVSWRLKEKKKKQIQSLILDKHAPPSLRVNLVVSQFQEWYDAFDIQPSDKLFISPEKRIHIF